MTARLCIMAALCAGLLMATAPVTAQEPDRSAPPPLGPAPELHLPAIQRFTLENGLPVVLLEKHTLPLLQVDVLVRAGSAADPEGKSGLASMTAAMMEEGAGTRNSLEFADAVDFLGASISAFAGWHSSGVSLHTPVAKIDSALSLLADAVLRPRFPAEELERQRKERLTTLAQWHDEPAEIASVLFEKTVFGDSHPYGRPSLGNEKSLRSFTVEDVKKFHGTYFHPNNATIIVVGDVTGDDIRRRLGALFGAWKPADIPPTPFPEGHQIPGVSVSVVDKPGAAQSEIIIGRVGTDRRTPDYFPLQVMNTILGGSFTSRLNQNLRETHGYTYGAGSGFDYRLHAGPFAARAAVQTAVTDKSLAEFFNELRGILSPVGSDELERAKNYLTLRYPRNFESVEEIANRLADIVVYGLPDSYFNDYAGNIRKVTHEDVERVAKQYIDPSAMCVIVVGDRKQIEAGISSLHLGPVKDLTVDDVLGPAPAVETTQ